jgi:hypothetical protein
LRDLDIYKAAWAQKGALLREVFTKAKIITPKRFLPHESRLPWTHMRPRGKTIKPTPAAEKGKNTEKEKDEHIDHTLDNLVESMISSDSGLALSHHTDFSTSSQSTFAIPQRPVTRTSLSDSGPIDFPGDQESSPTPRSLASSRGSSISYAVPGSIGEPADGTRSTSTPYFSFPMPTPPSPPPMSVITRPARERVLSLFKKGKKKEIEAQGVSLFQQMME